MLIKILSGFFDSTWTINSHSLNGDSPLLVCEVRMLARVNVNITPRIKAKCDVVVDWHGSCIVDREVHNFRVFLVLNARSIYHIRNYDGIRAHVCDVVFHPLRDCAIINLCHSGVAKMQIVIKVCLFCDTIDAHFISEPDRREKGSPVESQIGQTDFTLSFAISNKARRILRRRGKESKHIPSKKRLPF